LHTVNVAKPKIFKWTDHSVLLERGDGAITLPPKKQAESKFPETNQRNGLLDRTLLVFQRFLGKPKKVTGEETVDPDTVSVELGDVRRHVLRLSPDGLSIDGHSFRWIDIGEISQMEHAIEIFVVPIKQGPTGYSVLKYMKTTYLLEVPARRVPEIESAIRQFMKRWKPLLKGPYSIAK